MEEIFRFRFHFRSVWIYFNTDLLILGAIQELYLFDYIKIQQEMLQMIFLLFLDISIKTLVIDLN